METKIILGVFLGLLLYNFFDGMVRAVFPPHKESNGWVQDSDGSWYPKGHKYDSQMPL